MGTYQSRFDINDEVFVVFRKTERKNKVCPDCNGEPKPQGIRCIFCQGWGNVYDRFETVWAIKGPEQIKSVSILEALDGTVERYTITNVWDRDFNVDNVFPTETIAREYVESR